jgi:hypothetical protein
VFRHGQVLRNKAVYHVPDFAEEIETNVLNSKSYNETPQGQYVDPAYDFLDPAQGNPGIPLAESHPSRSPNLGGHDLQRQLGHPGRSETRSTRDGGGGAVQHSHSRQREPVYAPTGNSESRYDGRTPASYPAGAPTFDSTYPGPPYQSQGANASVPRSHQVYQIGVPGTRINPEPRYPGVPPTGLVQGQRQGQGRGPGGVGVGVGVGVGGGGDGGRDGSGGRGGGGGGPRRCASE